MPLKRSGLTAQQSQLSSHPEFWPARATGMISSTSWAGSLFVLPSRSHQNLATPRDESWERAECISGSQKSQQTVTSASTRALCLPSRPKGELRCSSEKTMSRSMALQASFTSALKWLRELLQVLVKPMRAAAQGPSSGLLKPVGRSQIASASSQVSPAKF